MGTIAKKHGFSSVHRVILSQKEEKTDVGESSFLSRLDEDSMQMKEQSENMNLPRESLTKKLVDRIDKTSKQIVKTVQIELHEEKILGNYVVTTDSSEPKEKTKQTHQTDKLS